jgi:hypothetical protein
MAAVFKTATIVKSSPGAIEVVSTSPGGHQVDTFGGNVGTGNVGETWGQTERTPLFCPPPPRKPVNVPSVPGIPVFMAGWDWHQRRLMRQFVIGASAFLVALYIASVLYFWPPWQALARSWVQAWANMTT